MAEAQEEGQEKSHEPTPRRLEKAREQGDIPHSQEAQTLMAYLGLAVAVGLGGAAAAEGLGETLMSAFAHPGALAREILHGAGPEALGTLLGRVALLILPALALPAALILALLIAQRAIVVAPDKIKPKLSRISPVQNAKQKYGVRGLVEFLKSTAKVLAIGAVVAIVVLAEIDRLAQYSRMAPRFLGGLLMREFWAIMTGVLLIAAAIAFFDVIWQRLRHQKRMRMSHQEVKDETKQAEGDPHLRNRQRERARDLAQNRMMHDVPAADVVVSNPTHYAVALKWDRAPGSAPVCVAKGVDHVALRIRAVAKEAGVPVHEDPPTARSIHALVEIGAEIRPEHYQAAAAAIIFADKLRSEIST